MNTPNSKYNNTQSKNAIIGIIIILLGVMLFLKNILPGFPSFLTSWPMLIIAIGFIIGIRSNFKNITSVVMIIIGTIALIHNYIFAISFYKALILPATIITIGCMIVIKDRKRKSNLYKMNEFNNDTNPNAEETTSPITYDFTKEEFHTEGDSENIIDSYFSVNAYFSGHNNIIYSKNLKRGDVTCVFGGADINFRQADFTNEIIIDVMVICGGLELKMPSNWYLKNELTAIFGGVDDKRNTYNITPNFSKRVILRGTVLMGGIEIKN